MRKTLQNFADVAPQESLGICAGDLPRLAALVNLAQEQLIIAGRDTGWWGGWEKVVFNVDRADPYLTLPPQFARVANVDVCRSPWNIQNEWYETLFAGIGLQSPTCPRDGCGGPLQVYDRGTYSTAFDLDDTNQLIRVYPTDARDVGKRILFSQALDQNEVGIYTQDALNPVNGFYLTLDQPYVETSYIVTAFKNVAKDMTFGDMRVTQVDNDTGDESLLARYKPWETNPAYRRYYFNGLPSQCCCPLDGDTELAQVTAMLKYEFVPVKNPSDFLIIGNMPALIAECESIKKSREDGQESQALSLLKHNNAIRYLRQEMDHYLGVTGPAIVFAPFGTAHLEKKLIGTMI